MILLKPFQKKYLTLLFAMLFVAPIALYAAYPIGDEVIHYELEDDVTNAGSGGVTYDSALSGSAAFTSTAKVGDKAVTFGASGDYVDTKYGTGVDPTTQSISIAFWAYKTAACSSGTDAHVFGASGPTSGTRMYIRCKDDVWQYRLGNASAAVTTATASINE